MYGKGSSRCMLHAIMHTITCNYCNLLPCLPTHVVMVINNVCVHCSPLSSEDENGFDASVDSSENDEGGGENPSNPKGNEFEVAEAMKLIHNDSGRRVSSQANSAPKDAYFSFLLMRHLRIRDLRNKVSVMRTENLIFIEFFAMIIV